jgi:hypothetical protein
MKKVVVMIEPLQKGNIFLLTAHRSLLTGLEVQHA